MNPTPHPCEQPGVPPNFGTRAGRVPPNPADQANHGTAPGGDPGGYPATFVHASSAHPPGPGFDPNSGPDPRPNHDAGPIGFAPPGAAPIQQAHYTAPQQPSALPRQKRGVPAWMALSGMLVVALIAGGSGGVAGSFFGGGNAPTEPVEKGPVMNEPPPEAPQRDPDTTAGVAQRVSPSVVSLKSSDPRIMGGGSGFVIEGDYVVTNDHVSSELETEGIVIEYSDGSLSDASVVGADPSSDLAVLSLDDPNDVEPLQFGDSDEVIVGDEVIAIGAPLGYAGTVTQGIISAVNRPVSSGEGANASRFYAIQTDAAINPGNSGGPLVDTQGRVIGVNSMIVTMGFGGEPTGNIGLGFAIPSTEVERVVEGLLEDGEANYADIGAELDLESQIAGAVIAEGSDAVERGGPADEAGLESGDVIVSFDSRPVNTGQELLAMLRSRTSGEEVDIEYERDGESEATTITLGLNDD